MASSTSLRRMQRRRVQFSSGVPPLGQHAGVSEASVPRPKIGDRNFVGDMGPTSLLATPSRGLILAPLTEHLRSPGGGTSLGVLVTLADVVASDPALAACNPDWTATQDLSLHAAGWLTEGPIVVETRLVRVGRKVVVVAAEAYDARGDHDVEHLVGAIDAARSGATDGPMLAASGLVTFARLPRAAAAGVDDHDPAAWVGQVRSRATAHDVEGTIAGRMGIRAVAPGDGVLELERTSYVVNSIGTINGGAQAILLQLAAEGMRPGLAARDMEVHYLSQVEAGPARTRGRVLRDGPDHSVVALELVDAGHDDQILALATVTLQRPPR